MIVTIEPQVDEIEWNNWVGALPEGTLYQHSAWAGFNREYLKVTPYFLTVWDRAKTPLARLLFFNEPMGYRRLFFERPMQHLLQPVLSRMLPTLQWHYGPLISAEDPLQRVEVSRQVVSALENFAYGKAVLNIAPSPPPIHGGNLRGWDHFFGMAEYKVGQWATYLVDLAADEEILWKRLDRSACKAVKRAQREGIVVDRVDRLDDLYAYYQLACQGSSKGRVYSFDNLAVMWRQLRPHGALEFFTARKDGQMLGGLGLWVYNGILTEFGAVRSERSRRDSLTDGDLIKWEIIRWGHWAGHRLYDLAGVSPAVDPQPKEVGIRRFKKKWGGQLVRYPLYGKVYPGIRGRLVKTAEGLIQNASRRISTSVSA